MARVVPVRESRVRVERTRDGLRLRPVPRRPWWRFVAPAWIALVVGFGLVTMLTGERPADASGGAFLVLWAGFGVALIGVSLYGLVYREELLVTSRELIHTRGVGPLSRSHAYDRASIEDVRVSSESMSPFDPRAGLRMYGVGGGAVAFDYGDRTIRVADVEEAEAKRVVAALRDEGV